MAALFPILSAITFYIWLHYYFYQITLQSGNLNYEKSNVGSTILYLVGVLLLVYRIEIQIWRSAIVPVRMTLDVTSIFITFVLMINLLWQATEYVVFNKLPTVVNNILEASGIDMEVEEWYFVPLLYGISFYFLRFANNSDLYFEYYFGNDDDDTISTDSESTEFTGYGDTSILNTGTGIHPILRNEINYRNNTTLPTSIVGVTRVRQSSRRRTLTTRT